MLSPEISIIVPVYNAEQYLHKCIDSILAQTLADFELWLIDDGSKDSSCEICDEYAKKDSRVHVVHKPRGGVSSARNIGLELAKGKYICFIDSDDWVDDNYLRILYPIDNEDLVCCSLVADRGTIIPLNDCHLNVKKVLSCNVSRFTFGVVHCKLFRSFLLNKNKIRFREDISAGEDILFVLEYFCCDLQAVSTKSDTVYHYHRGDNSSLSSQNVPLEESLKIMELLYEDMKKLSSIYNWNNDYALKEYLCSQFFNIIRAIRGSKNTTFGKSIVFFIVLRNYYVCNLLTDKLFWLTRARSSLKKKIVARSGLFCISLFYCLVGKPIS